VSQQSGRIPPYEVVYSGRCLEATRQLLANARARGRLAEITQAIRDIHTRLQWIPLDFGEPLLDFANLGIQARIATIAPLVVHFGVDEARRIVYVSLPFDLLSKSGL